MPLWRLIAREILDCTGDGATQELRCLDKVRCCFPLSLLSTPSAYSVKSPGIQEPPVRLTVSNQLQCATTPVEGGFILRRLTWGGSAPCITRSLASRGMLLSPVQHNVLGCTCFENVYQVMNYFLPMAFNHQQLRRSLLLSTNMRSKHTQATPDVQVTAG
jgi:hypothetical protein